MDRAKSCCGAVPSRGHQGAQQGKMPLPLHLMRSSSDLVGLVWRVLLSCDSAGEMGGGGLFYFRETLFSKKPNELVASHELGWVSAAEITTLSRGGHGSTTSAVMGR